MDELSANSTTNFFLRVCCANHKKPNRRELGLLKEEFRCTEKICLCSKTYCCYNSQSNKFKFSSKSLNKRLLEDNGNGLMCKKSNVLEGSNNLTSTKRGFCTVQHAVATMKGLS